jgi:hypothetical protein
MRPVQHAKRALSAYTDRHLAVAAAKVGTQSLVRDSDRDRNIGGVTCATKTASTVRPARVPQASLLTAVV